jgi:putative transposase
MVCAGVVNHPSQWEFSGYTEIQNPRRKNVLIAYQKLAELTGIDNYETFRKAHQEQVNIALE